MPSSLNTYQSKKAFFDRLLTIYGRKPVLEVLQDHSLNIYKIHLADSNKPGGIIKDITHLAEQRRIDIQWHNRKELSRISRNSKQDQGVAADIEIEQYQTLEQFLLHNKSPLKPIAQDDITSPQQPELSELPYRNSNTPDSPLRLLALCDIHNPQNLGMIIRSACAGNIDAILIPKKGCAALSPLVIKASAGTLFKAPIISCETLKDALQQLKDNGFSICALSSHATESLFEHKANAPVVYVLGNESEGVGVDIFNLADKKLMIPMANEVESLNVAVTAALIAFSKSL